MKNIQRLIIGSALFCMAGCEITGPSARIEPPKVKVDGEMVKVEGEKHDSGGKFCPPGQAKKGKC